MALLATLTAPYRASLSGLDKRIHAVVSITFLFIAARMGLFTFLTIFFVQERGIAIALVGAAFFVENMGRAVMSPLAGVACDRWGRRPVLVAGALASAALIPFFLVVDTVPALFAWSAVVGLAQGGFFPATHGVLLDLAPAKRRQSVLALNYTALSLGYTLGVAPAGFLAQASYGWLAGMSVALFAVIVGIAVLLLGDIDSAPRTREPMLRNMVRAPRDPAFLGFAALAFVFPLGLGLSTLALPVFASEHAISEATIGLVLASSGIVLALFTLPVNARVESRGPFHHLGLAGGLCAGSFLIYMQWPTPTGLLAGLAMFTFGEIVFASALPTAVNTLAPAHSRGAYQGAWSFVFAASAGASLFLAGLSRDAFGWDVTWALAAAVTLVAGVGFVMARRRFNAIALARET